MKGYCGVGNVSKLYDHQPLIIHSSKMPDFALTFDGFIINRDDLRGGMDGFLSDFDAELAGRIISQEKNIPDGIERLANEMKGYYCLGIITENGESYVARCPLGTKPLMLGEGKKGYAAITESRAFRKIGMRPVRDIEPGEIIKIDRYGVIHPVKKIKGKYGMKLCDFLYGYYGWVDSWIEGIPVAIVRERVAAKLAKEDKESGLKFDIATAIEDSGKAYGEGGAEYLGIPYKSGLIKYPYFGRSYDEPEEERMEEASGKVSSVDARIKDKILVVWEDSLRRGTVKGGGPIEYAWNAGAKEIHFRVGTPRNTHQCRLDFRDTPNENLPANLYPTDKQMAEEYFKVNSARFPTVDQWVKAILECAEIYGSRIKREDLCLGCYTGDFGFLE